jgi:hypothetical protein
VPANPVLGAPWAAAPTCPFAPAVPLLWFKTVNNNCALLHHPFKGCSCQGLETLWLLPMMKCHGWCRPLALVVRWEQEAPTAAHADVASHEVEASQQPASSSGHSSRLTAPGRARECAFTNLRPGTSYQAGPPSLACAPALYIHVPCVDDGCGSLLQSWNS